MHWQSSASSAWRGPFTALTSCAGCVAQVMAFGRAKKVGMKRALKFKAVAEPEAVPEARGTKSITPTAWAELPPWVAAQEPSLPTRVPPSPAKLQVNAAAAWCRHMDLKAHGCALAVRGLPPQLPAEILEVRPHTRAALACIIVIRAPRAYQALRRHLDRARRRRGRLRGASRLLRRWPPSSPRTGCLLRRQLWPVRLHPLLRLLCSPCRRTRRLLRAARGPRSSSLL